MPVKSKKQLAYIPFSLTKAIHDDSHRFRVLDCGRRFGKSMFALMEGLFMSRRMERDHGRQARGIVVAPTVKMLMEDWWMAKSLYGHYILAIREADMILQTSFGQIDFKSSESQGGVGRGAGYDWAVIDEAARVPQEAWEQDLRPALADRRGRAVFISTPFGRNWFYDLWRQGQDEECGEVASWRYTTMDGWRAIRAKHPERLAEAEEEWQAIIRGTSTRNLQQEYLADFLEQEGALWSVTNSLRGSLRSPIPGRTYVAGVDVARAQDWMAVAVMEVETRQLVALHRSRHRSWDLQKQTILHVLRQFPRLYTLVDSTGVGSPIANDFRNAGLSIEDYMFTNRSKKNLVDNLGLALDHGLIGIPDEPQTQWLLDELRSYLEIKTPAGNFKYQAPTGKHDDGATALMLAVWGLRFDLQRPLEPEQPPTQAMTGFSPKELWEHTERVKIWRRTIPSEPVPLHPHALAWNRHQRMKQAWDQHRLHATAT